MNNVPKAPLAPQPPVTPSSLESISSQIPLASLFLFNLLPLFGVIYLHWDVFTMMMIYWAESLIIGLFTILRMILAQQAPQPPKRERSEVPNPLATPLSTLLFKIFLVPFFCIHFGIFMFVHAVFIITFISPGNLNSILTFLGYVSQPSQSFGLSALPLLGLFAYHLISFIFNYIRPKAYQFTNPMAAMFTPYPRIIFTHIVLIIVSASSIMLSVKIPPTITAGIIVILKTFLDLYMYRRAQHEDRPSI